MTLDQEMERWGLSWVTRPTVIVEQVMKTDTEDGDWRNINKSFSKSTTCSAVDRFYLMTRLGFLCLGDSHKAKTTPSKKFYDRPRSGPIHSEWLNLYLEMVPWMDKLRLNVLGFCYQKTILKVVNKTEESWLAAQGKVFHFRNGVFNMGIRGRSASITRMPSWFECCRMPHSMIVWLFFWAVEREVGPFPVERYREQSNSL